MVALTPAQARVAKEVVLHNSEASNYTGVMRDSAGNLYGTTGGSGTANWGVVYKVDKAHRYKVLYNFTGGSDGANPYAGVIRDSAGNLYGTTYFGGIAAGEAGFGVVYKLDTTGNETVLYAFTGGSDGRYPQSGLLRDPDGNLYGTTAPGILGSPGFGSVYKVDTSGNETVLYNFTGGADGAYPQSGVIRDPGGNLYGTTLDGGAYGDGVVYKLDPNNQETVLYNFTGGGDGGGPWAGVVADSGGNLYGTTTAGGTANWGVVYKLDTSGLETVLYSFTGLADGGRACGRRDPRPKRNLYGTTVFGGGTVGSGVAGVVYEIDVAGQETVLHSFGISGAHPGGGRLHPNAGVVRDPEGNLYGTTAIGGKYGTGVIFEIEPQ